jgi:predicted permease
VDPSLNGYDLPKRREVLRTLRDELDSEPGVRSVSLAEVAVMTNSSSTSTIRVEGYEPAEGEDMNPWTNGVGPGFFDTLGIELVSGRDFDVTDGPDAPLVAVANEAFVRQFFPGTDPLGRRIGFGRRSGFDVTIVGVVRDAKSSALREPESRFLYLPYTQSSDLGAATFYLRVDASPEAVSSALPRAVARVDPSLPVAELKTMSVQIQESLFVERLVAALSLAFGTLAALLAALGLYGVMSYAVSLRTRELGIRAALGAARRGLLFIVLSEVSALTATGLALGAASGYVLGRLVESQLFGVSGRDPGVALLASLTLAGVSLAAGYLPAARASRVDPIVALRHE